MENIKAKIISIDGGTGKKFWWTIDWIQGENLTRTKVGTYDKELALKLSWDANDVVEIPINSEKGYDEKWGFDLDPKPLLESVVEELLSSYIPNLSSKGNVHLMSMSDLVLSTFTSQFYVGKPFREYSPSQVGSCKRQILLSKWFYELPVIQQNAVRQRNNELSSEFLSNQFGDGLHEYVYANIKHRSAYHSHERTLTMEFDTFKLKGKYDLLLELNGQISVIDVKTRKSKYYIPSTKNLDYYKDMLDKNMKQLSCYIVLLRNKYPDKKVIVGGIFEIFADLGKVRFIPYMFNPQDFEISKAFFESLTILESKHELPEMDRSYKKDTFPCSFCKFIPVCYQEEVK